MILVTGASGTVGKAVLDELHSLGGAPVRAMYRTAEDMTKAPPRVAAVSGDFSDRDSLRNAFAGIHTLFLVCSPIPQLTELESNAIDAAAASGVKHVVLNSALGAGKYDKSYPSWHHKVEVKLAASSLNYTILRPNGFFQNILAYDAGSIRSQNAFYGASANGKVSILDVRDVAAVAARILVSPQSHDLQTYELNGPEALSGADVASKLSEILGRAIKYVDLADESFSKALGGAGLPEWQVQALLELQQYFRSGRCGDVTSVLEDLLGRPPVRLSEFLNQHRSAFQRQP
jgi:uncharacterized protein YbjT (DUF2867 family)